MFSIGVNNIVHGAAATAVCLMLSQSVFAESLADYDVKDLLDGDKKTSRFSHRFGYTGNLYHSDMVSKELRSNSDQDLDSVSVLSDWHPRGGLFRLSAGLVYQEDDAIANNGAKPYQIPLQFNRPDVALRGSQVEGISPYLGLGWGSNLDSSGRMGLNLDLGVLYQPDSSILNDDGIGFSTESNDWDDAIMRGLDELDLEPVFSLGVSYNF